MNSLTRQSNTYMDAPQHVVAIVNPNSGMAGRAQQVLTMLRNRTWSAKVSIFETMHGSLAGHERAIDFARQHGADRLLISGGDGTLMDTLTTLFKTGSAIPMCMIPSGTGNIIANALQMPRRIEAAIQHAISAGKLWTWDVGKIQNTGHVFALRASAGHDAWVLAATSPHGKRRWGTLAYVLPALRTLRQVPFIDFTLTIDDGKPFSLRGITAFVAVTNRMTGRVKFLLNHDIAPDDGVLHVGVIHSKKLFRNLPKMALRRGLDVPGMMTIFPVHRQVRIDTEPPQRTQVDGELLKITTPLTILNMPQAAPFVIPLTAKH
jgi:diacylglycerol kinase family enzyme